MMRTGVLVLLSVPLLLTGVPAASEVAQQDGVAVQLGQGRVLFSIRGEEAGVYHTTGFSQPILWQAYAPGKVAMTRDWPMGPVIPGGSKDHPHHQSIWFCHGDVIPKGIELKKKVKGVDGVDFWSLAPNHGTIVCTDVTKGGAGPTWVGLDTTNEWRTPDGVKILDEKRRLTLHDLGKARLWVFDVTLYASVCPIVFGDTKEGAMALRVHDNLREQGGAGTLQNAEGKKTEKQCWGQKSAWCDYAGLGVGIAILDDPQNPVPACYHARAYGLMTANPFGRKKSAFPGVKDDPKLVELAKGESLHLRYGVLIHTGGTADGVAEYYKTFVQLAGKK